MAPVAQRIEHRNSTPKVAGSNPAGRPIPTDRPQVTPDGLSRIGTREPDGSTGAPGQPFSSSG